MATLLGFAIATTQGQTQSSTTTSYVQTSKIVGMKVKDSSGQEVGVVKDVVLDRNTGCMAYTVLSTGGTGTRVTGGGKTVAVPWTVYTTTPDPSVMTVRIERDRVYNAPAFDYARIDEYSNSGYINNIYSYYGVTPGVGVGVGASTATGTTTTGTTTTGTYGAQTGVAGQATTAGSPGAAASPAATAMASPTATVATSPAASPRASASPTATAKATATSTASRRPTATPSSEVESTGERRNHRHGESSATASPATSSSDETTTERATGKRRETTSEEGTSETGSSKKSKRSKTETSEESSPAEPSATP